MENKLLWLDDLRNPFIDLENKVPQHYDSVEWVLNYEQFIQWIKKFGLPKGISFDHDLGDINTDNEKTGMSCAKWLIDYCMDNNKQLPNFYVHSANSVGAKNIFSILNNYFKHSNK